MILSRYSSRLFKCRPCKTCSMSRWKVAGAEVRPKGNTFHFHNPVLVAKADFSLASASRGTCQYPLMRSSVLKNLLSDSASRLSSILGSGYAFVVLRHSSVCNQHRNANFHFFSLPGPLGSSKHHLLVLSTLFSIILSLDF